MLPSLSESNLYSSLTSL